MLLTPKGKSHRDLLPNQGTLQIASVSGTLTQTEKRTRHFTDSWKNNLLKQKPPNESGIQCYDPMLNRDIVKVLDEAYKKHIKLEGKSGRRSGQEGDISNETKNSDGFYHSPLLLKIYGSLQQSESAQANFDGTRDVVTATMNPPVLAISQSQNSGVGYGSASQLQKTRTPKPLSPSALVQKLRRYKIGHSPQQKVKNLMDDIGMSEKEWKNAKKEKQTDKAHLALCKQSGSPSPFDENDSMWEESLGTPVMVPTSDNADRSETDAQEIKDDFEEFFTGLERSQIEQMSNEDFLYLRQAMKQQGFSEVGQGHRLVGGATFNDSSLSPGHFRKSSDVLVPRAGATREELEILDDESADGFIYEDTSPEIEPPLDPLEQPTIANGNINVHAHRIEDPSTKGLRTGAFFESSDSNDSRTVSSYEHSINQIHAPEDGPPTRGIDVVRQVQGDADSRFPHEDMTSPIREGPQRQRGALHLPPFKWTQKEKEARSRCRGPARRVPRCYNCGKDAALWCNQCQVVSCYVCWGREDHHNADEAVIALAANQGRLEKYNMLRGTKDVSRHCKIIENAIVTLGTPGPDYSVMTGHNTATRKRRIRPEDASRYVYTPGNSRIILPSDKDLRPKSNPIEEATPANDASEKESPLVVEELELKGISMHGSYASFKNAHGDDTQISSTRGQISAPESARLILSARVPQTSSHDQNDFSALNETFDTVTELNVEVGGPAATEMTKSFSEEVGHEISEGVGASISFDLSQGASVSSRDRESHAQESTYSGERPVTAMTDDIDKLHDIGSFNSLATESSGEHPILSQVNADTLYYRQSMSPTRLAKKGDIQRRLHDTYVEYDDINVIHYSPAKRDPERVAFLANIYKDKVDITAERTKGYGESEHQRKHRADRISARARAQVTAVLENKTAMATNATKYKLDMDRDMIGVKIGKMKRRPPLHEPPDPNPLLTAIETFPLSPLNKQLVVPQVNADGSPNRKPPDHREKFFKEKAKKARRGAEERERQRRTWQAEQTELRRARDFFRKHGRLPPPQSSVHPIEETGDGDKVSEYGDDDVAMAAEPAMLSSSNQRLNRGMAVVNGGQEDMNSEHGSDVASTNASSAPGSSEAGIGVGPHDKWGWHGMRARSAKHGNVPSLPFHGPPYIVDIKPIKRDDGRVLGTSIEHRDAVHKVFSPAPMTIQRITSLW